MNLVQIIPDLHKFVDDLPVQSQASFDWVACSPKAEDRWKFLVQCGKDGFGTLVVLLMIFKNLTTETSKDVLSEIERALHLLKVSMESMVRFLSCRTPKALEREVIKLSNEDMIAANLTPSDEGRGPSMQETPTRGLKRESTATRPTSTKPWAPETSKELKKVLADTLPPTSISEGIQSVRFVRSRCNTKVVTHGSASVLI